MVNDTFHVGHPLLGLCAVLRWFDGDLLLALQPASADSINDLLASSHAVYQPATMIYQLHPDTRTAVLAHLRTEQPSAELALRTRIFTYYFDHLGPDVTDAQFEDCLYYFGELFPLLT